MSLPAAVTEETRSIRPCRTFGGHTSHVSGVIHLPGGQRIITCSYDSSLRVWDLQTGKQIANDWRDGERGVNAIALSPDGKKVASGSDDGAVRLWDVDTGKVIDQWTGHEGRISSVCLNRNGGQVVSGSYDDGAVRVWDVESGKTVLGIETGLRAVFAVIYSPDTTMIATGGRNNEEEYLKIWHAKTGKLVANLKEHTKDVNCLAWTADGKTLISGSDDHSVRTWKTTTWQQIAVFAGHTHYVWDIAISPNGRILASASLDGPVRLWNLENSQSIGSPLQHDASVNCVSFSADGQLLATGCTDNNAYIWDMSVAVKEAGLSDLLKPNDKSDPTATRRQGDWRRNPYPGPSNDSPHHHPSARHNVTTSSAAQQYHSARSSSHQHALLGHTSPSRRNNYHTEDIPTRPRFLKWAGNPFSHTRNSRIDEGVELQERRTEGANISSGQPTTPRYHSQKGVEVEKETAHHSRPNNEEPTELQQQPTPSISPHDGRHVVEVARVRDRETLYVAQRPERNSGQVGRIGKLKWWRRCILFICCTHIPDTDGPP